MKHIHIILPCGHDNLLPKRWLTAVCTACGARFDNLKD